ncbi:MAG: glycosyltransferase family 4 protein [Rhodospirillales bacterium]|jgi:UDP-N-acetylmuramyl pentapeptide phosphotransferase/UDP-N-acetylglucosamine-1-phosphate transferase|nr:glycosyltransferase family 4 protein [Rhodospirillales bacterium]MBT4039724.1 glycosyltransferase family 4 protein [Rhodospirillales bacterium]MBT4626159.1 glycosyltransferase family 4 protein [Rhodospirillales bacterium]MBT5350261.1 glycosyltransferase family 4 protein [Rhodospirillales bacterium]MBT5522299.1 glycosyltransferase family 4 protein [Rhodospirillales bacterium]
MDLIFIIGCFVAPLLLVAAGIWPLRAFLQRRAILDHPNDRSSHTTPTPKGGGLVVIPVLTLTWIGIVWLGDPNALGGEVVPVALLALFLCLLSWVDDLKNLPALLRLGSHAAAAATALYFMPTDMLVFQGILPATLDHGIMVIAWIWFINLFNFMDGIDGISGVQALIIGAGIVVVSLVSGNIIQLTPFAIAVAGVSIGFLIWNWHPARIFLGDTGSAPLGFLLGWLLIRLASLGEWEAALILPAYYLADATITLFKRLLLREQIWLAHREHFYQKAVQSGLSHASVTLQVYFVGVVLAASSVACAAGYTYTGFVVSAFAVVGLLVWFQLDHSKFH